MADFFWNGPLNEEEEEAALARAMDEATADERVSRDEVMAILRAPDGG